MAMSGYSSPLHTRTAEREKEAEYSCCCACLSRERKLKLLIEHKAIYVAFLGTQDYPISENRRVCWECNALLMKIARFQRIIIESNSVLQEILWMHNTKEKEVTSQNLVCKSKLKVCNSSVHDYIPPINENSEKCDYYISKNENECSIKPIKDEIEEDISEGYDNSDLVVAETLSIKSSTNITPDEKSMEDTRPKRKCNIKACTNEAKESKHPRKYKKTDKQKQSKTFLLRNKVKETPVNSGDISESVISDSRIEYKELLLTKASKSGPITIFKRSTKKSGYAIRPIDEEKFKILYLNDNDILQSRLEDSTNEKYMKQPHKCEHCIKGFTREDQLFKHNMLKHNLDAGTYACDLCACRFASPRLVRAHRRHHAVRFECRTCGVRQACMKDMWRHYAQAHGEEVYTCALCGLALRSAGAYRYHREGHKERAECDYCGRTFQSRAGLFSHIVTHMSLPPVPCPTCGKPVRNKYALSKHMSRHAARQTDAQHYCRDCNIHFSNKYSYKHHLNTSLRHATADSLKFACSSCDKRFFTEKRMTEHYNSVHLKRTDHQCTQCLKWFCNANTLRIHVRGVHERLRAPRDKICDHCGKAFYCAGSLRAHVRTHTGERPYVCPHCPAAFTQSSSLKTHQARVHVNNA